MRICIDCGYEQETGMTCQDCGAITFERQEVAFDVSQLSTDTEHVQHGRSYHIWAIALFVVIIIVLINFATMAQDSSDVINDLSEQEVQGAIRAFCQAADLQITSASAPIDD